MSTPITPSVVDITIVSNVVIVADDGSHYQVQVATSIESLCGGVLSYEVASGIYNLIYLSSCKRFEGVVVNVPAADLSETDETAGSVLLVTIREDVLNKLAGYQSKSLDEKLYELSNSVDTDR